MIKSLKKIKLGRVEKEDSEPAGKQDPAVPSLSKAGRGKLESEPKAYEMKQNLSQFSGLDYARSPAMGPSSSSYATEIQISM